MPIKKVKNVAKKIVRKVASPFINAQRRYKAGQAAQNAAWEERARNLRNGL